MKPFLERIYNGEILLGDGAMATMLFQRGLRPDNCPEKLNLTHPEILEEISQLYFNVGAEIISTNTFGGSPLRLSQYGLDAHYEEINRMAIKAVRKVIGDKGYLSASCGPSAKIEDVSPKKIYDSYLRQIQIFADEGVDIICMETMMDLREGILAVKAAKTIAPRLPVIASIFLREVPQGFSMIRGDSIEDASRALRDAGVDVIGSNCGDGIVKMIKIAQRLKQISPLPIWIQPNAGVPKNNNGKIYYPETPQFFAEKAKELIQLDVSIIGGCCGTTPEYIGAIKETIKQDSN